MYWSYQTLRSRVASPRNNSYINTPHCNDAAFFKLKYATLGKLLSSHQPTYIQHFKHLVSFWMRSVTTLSPLPIKSMRVTHKHPLSRLYIRYWGRFRVPALQSLSPFPLQSYPLRHFPSHLRWVIPMASGGRGRGRRSQPPKRTRQRRPAPSSRVCGWAVVLANAVKSQHAVPQRRSKRLGPPSSWGTSFGLRASAHATQSARLLPAGRRWQPTLQQNKD